MSDAVELNAVELAAELTIAWLGNQNNRVSAEDVPAFFRTMHSTVTELSHQNAEHGPVIEPPAPAEEETYIPAVSVRKSLASRDHILSLIDGKPYKTLRRHLSSHGLTPEQYRERYGLKADYPIVAESYSARRRDLAKRIGLGRKGMVAPERAAAKAPGAQRKG